MFKQTHYQIANKLLSLAREKRISFALAESCTGGLISGLITEIPGASDVFHYGAITYSNQAKMQRLRIEKEIFDRFGAVSEECVNAMIDGLKQVIKTDLYFAITGIAGPGGGSPQKPVGTIWFCCEYQQKRTCLKRNFNPDFDRQTLRLLSVETALSIMLDSLQTS